MEAASAAALFHFAASRSVAAGLFAVPFSAPAPVAGAVAAPAAVPVAVPVPPVASCVRVGLLAAGAHFASFHFAAAGYFAVVPAVLLWIDFSLFEPAGLRVAASYYSAPGSFARVVVTVRAAAHGG